MLQNAVLTEETADQRAHVHSMAGQKRTKRAGLISAVKQSFSPNAIMLTLCESRLDADSAYKASNGARLWSADG